MEISLRKIFDEYEKVFNGTSNAMFLVEITGSNQFRYVRNNLAHQMKTNISLEQFRNRTPQELFGKEAGDRIAANYQRCFDCKHPITYEEELAVSGSDRIWLTTLTPKFSGSNKAYIVGSSEDITERKRLELELEKSANYDKLTQIPNRRLLFEQLKQTLAESKRDGAQFALLFIDLDGFKEINDNYGHESGDKVLVTVADRLLKSVRESDFVARIGGDEFIVLLRNIKSNDDIKKIAHKINLNIKRVICLQEYELTVGSSIGIALYPENGKDADVLLRNSDAAMYSVKKNGKGGFKFFT